MSEPAHTSYQSHKTELIHATERRLALKSKGLEFLNSLQADQLSDSIRKALDEEFLDKFISISSEFVHQLADDNLDLKQFLQGWARYCELIIPVLQARVDEIMLANGAMLFNHILDEYKKEGSFHKNLKEIFSKHQDEELQHNFEFIECFGLGLPWIARMKLLASDLRSKLSDELTEEREILQGIEIDCNSLKEAMQKMAGPLSHFLY